MNRLSYSKEKIKKIISILIISCLIIAAGGSDTVSSHQNNTVEIVAIEESILEHTPMPTEELIPVSTPVLTEEPTPMPTLELYPIKVLQGAMKKEVAMLQKRLLSLGYYLSDETLGTYGNKTTVAVSEFQLQNGLEQSGTADTETCALLFSCDAMRCINFAELAPTVNMTFEELAGDDGIREYPEGYPASETYYIIVDIAFQVVMVYTKDGAGDYTVPVRYMLCSTGTGNRTPIGLFKLDTYKLRFSKFRRDGRYGQYWTQIFRAYYFHTFLYKKGNASSYDESTYLELGSKASHGCIRLTVPDARWV